MSLYKGKNLLAVILVCSAIFEASDISNVATSIPAHGSNAYLASAPWDIKVDVP